MMMTLATMATTFDGGNRHEKKCHGRMAACWCVCVGGGWGGGQAAGRHLGPGLEVNNKNRALRLQLASNQNNRNHPARTRSIPTVPLRTCQAHNSRHLLLLFFFATKKHVRDNELPAAPFGNAKALAAA